MRFDRIIPFLRRFRKSEDGVALVEFAIFLPLFLLAFFVVVEFSRVFFSYQGAVVGVRDAARYLARVAPADVCEGAGAGGVGGNVGGPLMIVAVSGVNTGNMISANGVVRDVIVRNMDTEDVGKLPGEGLGEGGSDLVVLNPASVFATYECVAGAPGDYRQLNVPIARVSATFEIFLPLSKILELNGRPLIPSIQHTVIDESRIYGY